MAGDNGSRRFIRLWWVVAFTAGAVSGAASITLIGIQDTIWWVVGIGGSLIVVTAIFERYGDSGLGLPRSAKRHWRPSHQIGLNQTGRKEAKPKNSSRRGRLRAINGKKIDDPPSSEES